LYWYKKGKDGLKTIKAWIEWTMKIFARHFLYSFRSTVLSLYMPIIIFFIFVTGLVSYWLAAEQIEKNAYNDIKNIVFQTATYMDNRFEDLLEQLMALSNDPDILRIINKDPKDIDSEDYLKIQSHVDTIRLFNSTLIDSVYLNFHDGNFVFFRGDYNYSMLDFTHKRYRKRYKDNPNDIYWRNFLSKGINSEETPERVVSVFKLFGREPAKINGIILFNLRYDFFEKVFSKSLLDQSGYLMIVSPEGVSTFKNIHNDSMLNDETITVLQQTKDKEGQLEFQNSKGEKMIVIYDTLPANQWKLAAVFTQEMLLDRVKYIKYTTFFVIILLMMIAVLLTNWLVSYITKPISGLVENMKRIRGENINFVSYSHPLNEVEILNQGVQDLVGRIKILLVQINEEQETKRQLELSVIQMQIHPHFLYNTLYSIKGLCDMGLNAEAGEMITALATFFRIGLSCGKEIISIEEEVSHARNYLFIQEMRYGDEFSYEIDIEPSILSYSIVKLTLQPLVENAIYHGVKQKRGKGWIKVKGYQSDGIIYFEVQDNGLGMTSERLQSLKDTLVEREGKREKIGFGVYSVFERLRLHYGKEAGLEIESEFQIGTVMKVIIPIKQLEGEPDA
jgi:two-component system, sensor histidine kinase YesM